MTDKDWLTLLAADEKHSDVWRAYADWLQDEEGNLDRAEAVRLAANRRWFPRHANTTSYYLGKVIGSWDWRQDDNYEYSCWLPKELFMLLQGGVQNPYHYFHEYQSCEDALDGLFNTLVTYFYLFR